MQGARFRYLAKELRPLMPNGVAKKRKKKVQSFIIKSIKGMKAKTEELLQNKGTKDTRQINAAWDSESNAFVIKDIIG